MVFYDYDIYTKVCKIYIKESQTVHNMYTRHQREPKIILIGWSSIVDRHNYAMAAQQLRVVVPMCAVGDKYMI